MLSWHVMTACSGTLALTLLHYKISWHCDKSKQQLKGSNSIASPDVPISLLIYAAEYIIEISIILTHAFNHNIYSFSIRHILACTYRPSLCLWYFAKIWIATPTFSKYHKQREGLVFNLHEKWECHFMTHQLLQKILRNQNICNLIPLPDTRHSFSFWSFSTAGPTTVIFLTAVQCTAIRYTGGHLMIGLPLSKLSL